MSDDLVPQTTPADATVSAPATVPATSGTPAPQQATPAVTSQPSATGGVPEGYVPSFRIRETREAAQREAASQFAAREAEIRAEIDQWKSKAQALAGFAPQPDPTVQTVKSQFASLYPGLAKIEEKAAQLDQLLERANDLESQNNHYWQSYGRQTMDRLFEKASESLGAPLNDEAKRALHSSFTGFVQSSPELMERYANDPTLIEDFWKAFTSSFIDPARRVATAGVVGRAAAGATLPQDTPGGVPRATPAPQPQNLDERASAAWQLYSNPNKS